MVTDMSAKVWVGLDWDDTLTWQGQLLPEVYEALWRLKNWGVRLALVTGRGAGFCQGLAGLGIFEAIVAENGQVFGWYQPDQGWRWQVHPKAKVLSPELKGQVLAVLQRCVEGLEPSEDNTWRLVDWALKIPSTVDPAALRPLLGVLRQMSLFGYLSSIHLHVLASPIDKRSGLESLWQHMGERVDWQQVAFMGDSGLDEPVFQVAGLALAPANVKLFESDMKFKPHWVADKAGGLGFVEACETILGQWVKQKI